MLVAANEDKLKLVDELLNQNKSLPYQSNVKNPFTFADWASRNKVPVDLSKSSDYDMTGFYNAQQEGNPSAKSGVSPIDNRIHFSDAFKTPAHETFSNESIYATAGAPHWEGNSQKTPEGVLSAIELPGGQLLLTDALKRRAAALGQK